MSEYENVSFYIDTPIYDTPVYQGKTLNNSE